MKVYVVYDDPMEEPTEVYGVFRSKKDAINKCKELAGSSNWGAAADPNRWDWLYDIKKVELK